MIACRAGHAISADLPNQALQSDSGAIDGALRALLYDAAAAERKR